MNDLVVQRREGLVLPAGRLLHRPVAAGRARRHHPRARRPCAPRPRPLPCRGAGRGRCCAPGSATRSRCRRCAYGEAIEHHGVRLSLASGRPRARLGAGAARARGRVWVASGDYYVAGDSADAREDNATCAPFEPVRCHCFITESTFGLPIYRWRPQAEVFAAIDDWWRAQRRGRPRQPDARLQLRQGAAHPAGRRPRRSGRSSCTARSSR